MLTCELAAGGSALSSVVPRQAPRALLPAPKYEAETGLDGKIEFVVPVPERTRVEVLVVAPSTSEFTDLVAAAGSRTDFWDNPIDDEDWNNA
jgi:hypothetical protein